jgi:hypothetical protein
MMLALFSMIGLPLLFLILVGPIPYVMPLIILASLLWFGYIMREAEVKIEERETGQSDYPKIRD